MPHNKGVKAEDSLIEQLCNIASISRTVASNLLEACNNNLEMALNMQIEGGFPSSSSPLLNTEDEVRAPIPQKQEILVEGPDQLAYSFRGRNRVSRSVFDKFRDFQAETRRQEEELMEEPASSSQSLETLSKNLRKKKTLEDLFRPPLDLMFKGSFQSARETGIISKKWLMVNVQNSTEFPCQVLNRDVWSNSAVKTIIQEHFIFWQIYHDSEEGHRYMTFYPVKEWPYIAVIDPRTGEKLVHWQKVDAVSFCDLITEFLSSHPSLDDSMGLPKSPPKKKIKKTNSIIEADEAAQLEAAIKASLEGANENCDTPNSTRNGFLSYSKDDDEVDDSDCLETFESDCEGDDNIKDTSEENSSYSSSCQNNDGLKKEEDPEKDLLNCENEEKEKSESLLENEKWKTYLGSEDDPESKLILRMPDGARETVNMPSTSKLMALVLFIGTKGFSNESYELVTNFPKRRISYMDFNMTLESVGLFPQETIFIQKR